MLRTQFRKILSILSFPWKCLRTLDVEKTLVFCIFQSVGFGSLKMWVLNLHIYRFWFVYKWVWFWFVWKLFSCHTTECSHVTIRYMYSYKENDNGPKTERINELLIPGGLHHRRGGPAVGYRRHGGLLAGLVSPLQRTLRHSLCPILHCTRHSEDKVERLIRILIWYFNINKYT